MVITQPRKALYEVEESALEKEEKDKEKRKEMHKDFLKTTHYPNDLRFDHTPEQIEKEAKELIEYSNKVIAKIISIPKSERTFLSIFNEYSKLESHFSTKCNNLCFYRFVSSDPKIR